MKKLGSSIKPIALHMLFLFSLLASWSLAHTSVDAQVTIDKLHLSPINCKVSDRGGDDQLRPRSGSKTDCNFVLAAYVSGTINGATFGGSSRGSRFSDFVANNARFSDNTQIRKSSFVNGSFVDSSILGTDFEEVDFIGTIFQDVSITNTAFRSVNLTKTAFKNVVFDQVQFDGVDMFMSNIEGVDLTKTSGLTQRDISSACGDVRTRLPAGLHPAEHWPCHPAMSKLLRELTTHIQSGENLKWHDLACTERFTHFRRLSGMPIRNDHVFRQYLQSYGPDTGFEFHFATHPMKWTGKQFVPKRATGHDCNHIYAYQLMKQRSPTQRDLIITGAYFIGRIDCDLGGCFVSGESGTENGPGYVGRLEVELNDAKDAGSFIDEMTSLGATDFRASVHGGREIISFNVDPPDDRVLLSRLQVDHRIFHAGRASDAIGGSGGRVDFTEKGLLEALELEQMPGSSFTLAEAVIKASFPKEARISSVDKGASWHKFWIDNIRDFAILESTYWERYEVNISFRKIGDITEMVFSVEGLIAKGVGKAVPAEERYRRMEPKYTKQLEQVRDRILLSAQRVPL